MDPLVVGVAMGVFVGVVGVGAWWFSPAQRAKRTLRSMPVRPISSLRPGERAKVSGRVVLGRKRLTSPIRGSDCAYWAVHLEEHGHGHGHHGHHGHGHHGDHHDRQIDQWDSVPFWLDDGTGRVYVDVAGRRLPLPPGGGATGFLDAAHLDDSARSRLGLGRWSGLGSLRFEETSLDADEQVAAIGDVAIVEIDGAPVVCLTEGADGLVISDAGGVHG